jgi:8-oxo-dGTP diphosphatase
MNPINLQVGVKVLMKSKDGKFLFLHRSAEKYPEVNRLWDFPGGRIAIGTPLLENLEREVKEETGLSISGQPKLLGAQDILKDDRHIVRLTYVASTDGEGLRLSEEHDDFAWLSLDEIRNREDFDKYLRALLATGVCDTL